jgi:hypothetical protein
MALQYAMQTLGTADAGRNRKSRIKLLIDDDFLAGTPEHFENYRLRHRAGDRQDLFHVTLPELFEILVGPGLDLAFDDRSPTQ